MTDHSTERRVELFVRSLSPDPTRGPGSHLARLRNLTAAEPSLDLSVTVWGREVGLSNTAPRTDAGRFVLDRVGAFKQWADERGVSLDPFFETRAVGPCLTGEEYTALVLPVASIAEYEDGELVHVAPYTTESGDCSVGDRIRDLESRGRPAVRAAVAVEDTSTDPVRR